MTRRILTRHDNLLGPIDAPPEDIGGGQWMVSAPIASAGVYIYHDTNGREIRELKPPEELFDEQSMRTLVGKSVTLDHPPERVNSENYETYNKGTVLDVERRGNDLVARMTFGSKDMADAVANGVRQFSPGYDLRNVNESGGDGEFGEFDQAQEGIVYNHLALVDEARGGDRLTLRLDSKASAIELKPKGTSMKKSKLKQRFDALAEKLKRDDQLEVGSVTIQLPGEDGLEPLTLPVETIMRMLDVIGASTEESGSEEQQPEGDQPPAGGLDNRDSADDQVENEDSSDDEVDNEDSSEDEDMKNDSKRNDSVDIQKLVQEQVKKELGRYDSSRRQHDGVVLRAAKILPENYRHDNASTWKIMADVVSTVDSSRKDSVEALVKSADKGSLVDQGRLAAMFDMAIEQRSDAKNRENISDAFSARNDSADSESGDDRLDSRNAREDLRKRRLDRKSKKKGAK